MNKVQRKFRKLMRDPSMFFKDMKIKHVDKWKKRYPIKYEGNFNYTIVSAVYNVEKYLDEYFDSIVNQSLNFKKHIHIILVDDGSIDNSAEIIKKWQKKYPENIHYYYKENGGQASARNLGLQYVETDWVTFIDPDDFVNADYFRNIDDVLTKNKQIQSVVCNIQMYRESTKTVSDAHPLKYRFPSDVNIVEIDKLGKHINLSAAISFFNMQPIRELEVSFDDKVKPSFEDAKFVADYLLNVKGSVAFLKNSLYFYRKREDGSSTLDKAGQDYKRYTDIYQYGVIPMLQSYHQKYGKVPENIQITALYDFIWQLKLLLNNAEKVAFLTAEQKSHFYALCHQLFEYIDEQQINRFSLADAWFFHKVGMLGQFKKAKPNSQICYVEEVDLAKKQILVAYYTHFDVLSKSMLDNQEIVPAHKKDTANYLNEELFVWEKRMWLPFDDEKQTLSIWIDGALAELKFGKKSAKKAMVANILQAFTSQKYQSDGSWLLMDRETKADDNAEHLYRYLMNHHPEQACYFALNRDSADWDRLADEGFKLVAFGKPEFETRLAKVDKIISSHIDAHIHNYFGDLYAGTKKFVFLQHGVTKDNLSRWLNGKKHVACFITTTKDEYQSIAFGERYKFSEKEVALTGFPRHDELYRKNQNAEDSKTILIMPTWRSYLMGETVGKGANTRTLNPKFLKSTYATHWSALLHSDKLKTLADKYGYQVIFAPHANIEPYLPQMNLPSYLTIWSASKTTESMQDLFVRASMMITDYSSVAFEMAYIGKPTLYYQFDKDEFFSGSHSYQKGYFDYEQHGFGAVSYDEASLLAELSNVLANGVGAEYQHRINNTFAHRDDGNCERVYQAIKALDEPSDNVVNVELLRQMMNDAHQHEDWQLLAERAEALLTHEPDNKQAQALLVEALTQSAQWDSATKLIEQYDLPESDELAFLSAMARHDWQKAVAAYPKITPSFEQSYQYLHALTKLGQTEQAVKFADKLAKGELSPTEQTVIRLMLADLAGDDAAVIAMANLVDEFNVPTLSTYKPQLILSKAYRNLGEYDLAHQELVNFEKHTRDDADCRLAIAELAFVREYYGKSISQFERLISINYPLTATEQKRYLDALFLAGQYEKYTTLFENANTDTNEDNFVYRVTADNQVFRAAYIRQDWQSMVSNCNQSSANFVDSLLYVQALQKLNQQQAAKVHLEAIQNNELAESEQLLVNLLQLDFDEKYQEVTELTEQIAQLSALQKQLFKPQLLLAKAHRLLGNHDLAHSQLVAFEKHTRDDVDCRLEIAKLAFAREQYGKCVNQLEKLQAVDYSLDSDEQKLYLQAVYLIGGFAKYIKQFEQSDVTDTELQIAYVKSLVREAKYKNATQYADEQQLNTNSELAYELTLAKYRLGLVEEAYQPNITLTSDDSYDHWALVAEIACLMEDKELEKRCYRGMIAIYPDRDKQKNIEYFLKLKSI